MDSFRNLGVFEFLVLQDIHYAYELFKPEHSAWVDLVADEMNVLGSDEVNEKIKLTSGQRSAKWVRWVCDKNSLYFEIKFKGLLVSLL